MSLFAFPVTSTPVPFVSPNVVVTVAVVFAFSLSVVASPAPVILIPVLEFSVLIVPVVILSSLFTALDRVAVIPLSFFTSISPVDILAFASVLPPV